MKKKLYPITMLLITAAFGLSSCLKESKYYVNLTQGKPLAELPLASYNGGSGNLVPEALPISSTPQVIPTVVNVASVNPLSTATTFTLALDTAAVTAYNTANSLSIADGDAYTLLPAADYTVTSWSVTVPAGQRTAKFNISINTSLVNPALLYILPIKLVSASGLTIDQYDELLYNVQAKNQYDGVYTVTGTLSDNTSAAITGAYPETVQLQTQGSNSDAFYDVTYSLGLFHPIDAGNSYYGTFDPVFTFNGSTVTSVTNYYGQSAGSHLRSAVLDPNGVNTYTTGTPGAAGSVFQVSYFMDQAGVPRTHFVETFTYVGSR